MQVLSQKDPRWAHIGLGTCPDETIGSAGCLLTCFSMLGNTTPDVLNERLKANKGYQRGCLIVWGAAAAQANVGYGGQVAKPNRYPVIAETDHFKASGYPSHFYILFKDGTINDPLDGKRKPNPYNAVAYFDIQLPVTNTNVKYLSAFKNESSPAIYGIIQFDSLDELHAAGFTDNSQVIALDTPDILKEQGLDPLYLKLHLPTSQFGVPFGTTIAPLKEYPSLDLSELNSRLTNSGVEQVKQTAYSEGYNAGVIAQPTPTPAPEQQPAPTPEPSQNPTESPTAGFSWAKLINAILQLFKQK